MNQTFNGDVETEISCKTTKLLANNTLQYNKIIIKIPRTKRHPLSPLSLGDKTEAKPARKRFGSRPFRYRSEVPSAALPRRARLRRQPKRKASPRGDPAAGPRGEMSPRAAPAPPGDLLLCLFPPERPPEGWPWELVGGSGGDAAAVPHSSGGAVLGCRPLGSTVRGTDAPVSFLPRGSKRLGFPKDSPLCLSSVPRTAGGLGGDAGLRATPLCVTRSARPRRGRFCGQQPHAASRGQILRPVPSPGFRVTPEDASLLLCCCGAVLPASRPEQCSHLCRSASRITEAGICTGGRGFGEIERKQNLLLAICDKHARSSMSLGVPSWLPLPLCFFSSTRRRNIFHLLSRAKCFSPFWSVENVLQQNSYF